MDLAHVLSDGAGVFGLEPTSWAETQSNGRAARTYDDTVHPPWFEFDEHDETPENCDPSQREFLRLVREGAQEWPCRPCDTYVLFFPRDELDEDGNTAEHD